jgi:hypothetical protein
LHLCNTEATELLTKDNIQPGVLTARNRKGLIPLHAAVSNSNVDLVELLLKAAARSNTDINIENGMGDSPLDIARQQFWLNKTRDAKSMGAGSEPTLLSRGYSSNPPNAIGIDVSAMEERLADLKGVIAELAQSGNLVHGTPVADALREFVSRLDKHVEHLRTLDFTIKAKKEDDVEMQEGDVSSDQSKPKRRGEDRQLVLEMVQNAYATRKPSRKLVHLEDVQEFVQLELDRRHAEAEKNIEAKAKAAEYEGGLLEGHKSDDEEEQEPAFYGFRAIGAYKGPIRRRVARRKVQRGGRTDRRQLGGR